MSITYGFYNSLNGDRKYNAQQMTAIFNGIINDGVFMSIGDALMVQTSGGMTVNVGTGRAWFNSTWTHNDAPLILNIEQSEAILDRIDIIVLEIDANDETRANSIKVIKGNPSSTPVAPPLITSELVNQHPLAHIYIGGGVSEIKQANITNKVGTSECPFVTGILQTINIDPLISQWIDEFSALISQKDAEFTGWFATIVDVLDENAAGNLYNLIQERVPIGVATWGDLKTPPEG